MAPYAPFDTIWRNSHKPFYAATGKRDTSYMGRFTFRTFTEFEGLGRILTIIARSYLFNEGNNP